MLGAELEATKPILADVFDGYEDELARLLRSGPQLVLHPGRIAFNLMHLAQLFAVAMFVAAVGRALLATRAEVWAARLQRGECPGCGYPVAGLAALDESGPRCPECGADLGRAE